MLTNTIDKIKTRMMQPWETGSISCTMKLHLAAVFFPTQVQNSQDAMHALSLAMSEAKRTKSGKLVVFDEDMLLRKEKLEAMRELLHENLAANSLVVHYQPIFELPSMRMAKAEALVRMVDREGNLVPPGDFIPMAEETGIIVALTEQVVCKVGGFLAGIKDGDPCCGKVAVNFSAIDMMRPDIVDHVAALFEAWNVDLSRLEIELTESAMIQAFEDMKQNISSFMQRGVSFALDDFGKGYSNLRTLMNLPFDIVKLDKEILPYGMTRKYMLRAIVNTLHKLGKKVTVEGVEIAEHLELCNELGVDYVQGFYLAKPMEGCNL